MSTVSNRSDSTHELSEKAITLMLSYIRGELTGQLKDKVTRAIKRCQCCNNLYHELLEFVNPVANLCYEVTYEEELKQTENMLRQLSQQYDPVVSKEPSVIQKHDNKSHLQLNLFENSCLGFN